MKIFIIGPGGVGKTTCGTLLAKMLDYKFIDLDTEFCAQIDNVGNHINTKGYESYCYENSRLFYQLLKTQPAKFIFALSSGFLIHENLNDLTQKHHRTIKELGLSILLLPSKSLEEGMKIIVDRQMSRGFGLNPEREKIKYTKRFHQYQKFGDIKIYSHDAPEVIAGQIYREIELL
jgi:shikimate kinase